MLQYKQKSFEELRLEDQRPNESERPPGMAVARAPPFDTPLPDDTVSDSWARAMSNTIPALQTRSDGNWMAPHTERARRADFQFYLSVPISTKTTTTTTAVTPSSNATDSGAPTSVAVPTTEITYKTLVITAADLMIGNGSQAPRAHVHHGVTDRFVMNTVEPQAPVLNNFGTTGTVFDLGNVDFANVFPSFASNEPQQQQQPLPTQPTQQPATEQQPSGVDLSSQTTAAAPAPK